MTSFIDKNLRAGKYRAYRIPSVPVLFFLKMCWGSRTGCVLQLKKLLPPLPNHVIYLQARLKWGREYLVFYDTWGYSWTPKHPCYSDAQWGGLNTKVADRTFCPFMIWFRPAEPIQPLEPLNSLSIRKGHRTPRPSETKSLSVFSLSPDLWDSLNSFFSIRKIIRP